MILQGPVMVAGYLYTMGGPHRARNYLAGHAGRRDGQAARRRHRRDATAETGLGRGPGV